MINLGTVLGFECSDALVKLGTFAGRAQNGRVDGCCLTLPTGLARSAVLRPGRFDDLLSRLADFGDRLLVCREAILAKYVRLFVYLVSTGFALV